MSDPKAVDGEGVGRGASLEEVRLSAADIPGAELSEPFDQHTVAALRWWLLCRGMKVATSMKKKELIDK